MRARSDLSDPIVFDPFGEPVASSVAQACPSSAGDRVARRVGGGVFWTLALLILAGRIYASDKPVMHTVAEYVTWATAWM